MNVWLAGMIGRGSSLRSRPPSPRGGFATLKPRWSFSQTKTGRLQSASRSADFGWSCCPTCSTAPPAQSLRNSGAWGLPECPAVALPSQASAALPHLQTSGGSPAQKRIRADNILPDSETHRRPTARLGLGSRRPLASVGKESHQSRGRTRKRGLPRPVRHPSPVPRAKTGCLWLGPRARLRLMAGAGSRQIR